jgi:asparagine synthase (glutamine-hydrolysing)
MTNALAHRGPDADGLYCRGAIGLGHRRLSIIDLSSAGEQPIWNASRTRAIIYNGEVYNYREIRDELLRSGTEFRSESDTEVILEAIDTWGIDKALARCIGMFAFAIWDEPAQTLTLCRDRVGIKPLYYSLTSARLLFASELKALHTHPGFDRTLDLAGVGQALVTGYAIGAATPFAQVRRLPAGHTLVVQRSGGSTLRQYWSLDRVVRGSFKGSFEDALEELLSLCTSAFQYRLVADVPVGLFQSGGVDSSLVAAVLKKQLQVDVPSVTIGFSDKQYNEVPVAESIARTLGTKHLVHYVSMTEAQEVLERFVDVFDEPFGDTSGIPTYILSRIARSHFKVALSADGGDEQFCGYESYGAYAQRAALIDGVPLLARQALASVLGRWAPLHAWLSRPNGAGDATYAPQTRARYEKMIRVLCSPTAADVLARAHEFGFRPEEVSSVLPDAPADPLAQTRLSAEELRRFRQGPIDAMMRTDFTTYLPDDILVKVDRASMAASLECRDPMLDHRLAEFAFSLPIDYLYRGAEHKRLLRALASRWIGRDLLNRPKRGFVVPLYHWLRGVWKPIVMETLSDSRVARAGVLDPKFVATELRTFYSSEGRRAERIWMLLNVQMWADRWLLQPRSQTQTRDQSRSSELPQRTAI